MQELSRFCRTTSDIGSAEAALHAEGGSAVVVGPNSTDVVVAAVVVVVPNSTDVVSPPDRVVVVPNSTDVVDPPVLAVVVGTGDEVVPPNSTDVVEATELSVVVLGGVVVIHQYGGEVVVAAVVDVDAPHTARSGQSQVLVATLKRRPAGQENW